MLSTLAGTNIPALTISYDIACQWCQNFIKCMLQFPPGMQLPPHVIDDIKYRIPKLHISSHGPSCQSNYSFNFSQYSARTDGEEPERLWAHMNPVSMSTREMGPGAWHDTLDDHAASWNWRKITNLGHSLLSKLELAIQMRKKHAESLSRFSERFPEHVVEKWERMIDEWHDDERKPNPYVEPTLGL